MSSSVMPSVRSNLPPPPPSSRAPGVAHAAAPAPAASIDTLEANQSVQETPRYKNNVNQKRLIGAGLGLLAIGAGVGTFLGVRSHQASVNLNAHRSSNSSMPTASGNASVPVATNPAQDARYNNTGITVVAAYNKAYKTNYPDTQAGFASLKQIALGDFITPQLFADYACSGAQANISCTLNQALQGNKQQINLPLVIVDEDLRQNNVSLSARCDAGADIKAYTFTAPLPKAAAGNSSRGFFSLLNSPDIACTSNTGAAIYNFHYNITAAGQQIGANNSVVLFKRNAAGQITDALIGVNPGDRSDAMYFNAPIYNLQTSY